jgi:hypothetical protein
MVNREPRLTTVPVAELRPTQMTVGFREVEEKRRVWREQADEGGAFLGKHMIPVLLGPKKRSYVIDHHHLSRALLEEGVEEVATVVIADLSHLAKDAFWVCAGPAVSPRKPRPSPNSCGPISCAG